MEREGKSNQNEKEVCLYILYVFSVRSRSLAPRRTFVLASFYGNRDAFEMPIFYWDLKRCCSIIKAARTIVEDYSGTSRTINIIKIYLAGFDESFKLIKNSDFRVFTQCIEKNLLRLHDVDESWIRPRYRRVSVHIVRLKPIKRVVSAAINNN